MIVAVGVDEKSLQRRLFKFTGCRGRPIIDIPKEILELYFKHHFTPVQIAQLFCVSTKTIRRRLNEFQLHVEKQSCLMEAELEIDTINLVCLFCVLILVLDWVIPFKTRTPPLPLH